MRNPFQRSVALVMLSIPFRLAVSAGAAENDPVITAPKADAKVRLVAHVELKMSPTGDAFPPDILLSPKVTSADLQLQAFELQRLGAADGPLVKQLGEAVEEGAQDYLAEHREKLAEKMNKAIDKKRDKLRIPLSKLTTSKWGKWFGEFLQ